MNRVMVRAISLLLCLAIPLSTTTLAQSDNGLTIDDLKERYRASVRKGIDGNERFITPETINEFLKSVVRRCDKAVSKAKDSQGFLSTYFVHEVTKYDIIEKVYHSDRTYVFPTKFKCHRIAPFLEGYVHALRVERDKDQALNIYQHVQKSR